MFGFVPCCHPLIGTFSNAGVGIGFSGIVAGTRTSFPEVPLSSGSYWMIDAELPENTVVNAPWPTAVTNFRSGAYKKTMNALFKMWSRVPSVASPPLRSEMHRAMSSSFLR